MVKISWCFFRLSAQGGLMLPAWKKSHHFIGKWRVRPRLRLIVLLWHLFLNFWWNRYKKLDNTSEILTYLKHTHKKNILNKYVVCNCLIFFNISDFYMWFIYTRPGGCICLIDFWKKKLLIFFGVSFSHKLDL